MKGPRTFRSQRPKKAIPIATPATIRAFLIRFVRARPPRGGSGGPAFEAPGSASRLPSTGVVAESSKSSSSADAPDAGNSLLNLRRTFATRTPPRTANPRGWLLWAR